MPFLGSGIGDTFRNIGALSAVGFMFVLAIVIGALFGWWLDQWLGTSPVLFIVFFFLGVAAGILNVYRMASRFLGPDSSQRSSQPPAPTRDV